MSPAQTDRPAFEITVAGAALAPLVAADVVEVDVHEEVGRHGRCALLVQNWDADARAVRHSDRGPFVPGKELAVSLGYHADLTPVFAGVIASITAHFPARGRPVLRVEARTRSILLEHPPRSRQLAQVSDADVAAAIAADYGLSADAEDGVTRPFVVSDRISDWDFLKARAAELGWALYVRDQTLVMRAPASPDAPPALDYTRDLVELQLTQDLTRAAAPATGVGWDVAALAAVESEESDSAAGLPTGDRPTHTKALEDAGWPLRSTRDEKPAEQDASAADARAVGRQRDAILGHLHGRGVVLGNPALRCDGWVQIGGVGARMSGPHYLSAVRHRLSGSGFQTELQVGRPPTLLPPTAPRPLAPLALGVVADLDDPDAGHRVKVRLPWRSDSGDGVWARLATLDAGDGYGTVFLPDVGQEVLVGYLDDDPAAPVVLGQLFNGQAAPPVAVDPQQNQTRAIVTPGGHAITLVDGADAALQLVSGKGHSIVIDDAGGAVILTHADSGNAIKLSGNGIELSAESGDIVLKVASGALTFDASRFDGKASGPSKLASSATFDLEASGPLGLKGALVKIN